jgi:hypothetical protein
VELLLKCSSVSGAPDGEYHCWITDDKGATAKVMQYANLQVSADPINYFEINPLFGDNDPSFTRTMDHYFFIGHWKVKGGPRNAQPASMAITPLRIVRCRNSIPALRLFSVAGNSVSMQPSSLGANMARPTAINGMDSLRSGVYIAVVELNGRTTTSRISVVR